MKRVVIAAVVSLALCVSVSAGWNGYPDGFSNPVVVSGGSPTWTGTGAIADGSCGFSTSCNVSTTASVTSGVVVAIAGVNNQGTGAGSIGITICGTSFTMDVSPSIASGALGAAMGHGTVTGGTCTVTVTISGTGNIANAGIAYGTLNNLNSSTPGTSCSANYPANQASPYPCPGGLTVSSGGFGIVGYFDNQTTVPTSPGTITVDKTAQNTGGTTTNVAIGHVISTCTAAQCEYAAAGFAQATVIGEPFR